MALTTHPRGEGSSDWNLRQSGAIESLQQTETGMTDQDRTTPAEAPSFETDTVQADRAREQGLGLGQRELDAQRDPGGVRTADDEDPDALDQSVGREDSAPGERADSGI